MHRRDVEAGGIFLSYASAAQPHDYLAAFQARLGNLLKREVYYDQRSVGDDRLSDELNAQLAKSTTLIAFVCDDYFVSRWCRDEVMSFVRSALAKGRRPRLLPVLLQASGVFDAATRPALAVDQANTAQPGHLAFAHFLASYAAIQQPDAHPEKLADAAALRLLQGNASASGADLGFARLACSLRLTDPSWAPIAETPVQSEAELRRCIESASPGRVLRIVEPMSLRQIRVPKGVGLVATAHVLVSDRRDAALALDSGGWAFGLTIQSQGKTAVRLARGTCLFGCTVNAPSGMGAVVDDAGGATVLGCTVEGANRAGIVVQGGDVLLAKSTVRNVGHGPCIDVVAGRARMRRNLIGPSAALGVIARSGASLVAEHNSFTHIGTRGLEVSARAEARLVANDISNCQIGIMNRGTSDVAGGRIARCTYGISNHGGGVLRHNDIDFDGNSHHIAEE